MAPCVSYAPELDRLEKQITSLETRFAAPIVHDTQAVDEPFPHSAQVGTGAFFILASGIANVVFTQFRYGFANRYPLHVGMGLRETDGGEALAREDLPRCRRGILGDLS